jgi:hypothetical protein
MKSNLKKLKNSFILLMAVFVALTVTSCSKKIVFNKSEVVPAAEAKVKVKTDNNNNHRIELNVTGLAEPSRLTPSKNSYLVWIDTESNGTKNIGQLKIKKSLFSSALKGSLTTVTSFKPTKIYITAEDDTNIQYPGGQTVLTTESF